jgi:cytochrome c-type biogenesis protein CcmH
MAVLSEQLPQIAELAGVRYRLPEATAPGPTGADMAAAAEMSGADRLAMIEGMVEQLSSRLDTQGGSAEEWTQLVTSLAVLGRMDEARAALVKAEAALGDDAAGLDALRAAATGAGVTP